MDTLIINNNVQQKAFDFGRQYFYMPDLTTEDYNERINDLTEQAVEEDGNVTPSMLDIIKDTIINIVEEGFSIEADA